MMLDTRSIRIDDYDYPLPDERIAKFPLARRDSSQLLVYKNGAIGCHVFSDLPSQLPDDVMLVFNNTRVIQARMHFRKATTIYSLNRWFFYKINKKFQKK